MWGLCLILFVQRQLEEQLELPNGANMYALSIPFVAAHVRTSQELGETIEVRSLLRHSKVNRFVYSIPWAALRKHIPLARAHAKYGKVERKALFIMVEGVFGLFQTQLGQSGLSTMFPDFDTPRERYSLACSTVNASLVEAHWQLTPVPVFKEKRGRPVSHKRGRPLLDHSPGALERTQGKKMRKEFRETSITHVERTGTSLASSFESIIASTKAALVLGEGTMGKVKQSLRAQGGLQEAFFQVSQAAF